MVTTSDLYLLRIRTLTTLCIYLNDRLFQGQRCISLVSIVQWLPYLFTNTNNDDKLYRISFVFLTSLEIHEPAPNMKYIRFMSTSFGRGVCKWFLFQVVAWAYTNKINTCLSNSWSIVYIWYVDKFDTFAELHIYFNTIGLLSSHWILLFCQLSVQLL